MATAFGSMHDNGGGERYRGLSDKNPRSMGQSGLLEIRSNPEVELGRIFESFSFLVCGTHFLYLGSCRAVLMSILSCVIVIMIVFDVWIYGIGMIRCRAIVGVGLGGGVAPGGVPLGWSGDLSPRLLPPIRCGKGWGGHTPPDTSANYMAGTLAMADTGDYRQRGKVSRWAGLACYGLHS